MSNNNHLRFKGLNLLNWKEDSLSKNISGGIIRWMKWSFLEIRGYMNIVRNTSVFTQDNTPMFRLVRAKDDNITEGRVYQGFAADWVWETGLSQGGTPQAAQIYVDGSLKAANDATYGHYIDYPRGRVVFNSVVASSAVVEANFSFRTPSIVKANLPWFQELMFEMFRVDRAEYAASLTSGNWNQLADTRRQMPVIGLELINRRASTPYELGNGNLKWRFQDVLFHVFAESDDEINYITDILEMQDDKAIYLLDIAAMQTDAGYPHDINYRGELVSSPITYPSLVSQFSWVKGVFSNTLVQRMDPINPLLHRAVVRTTFTVIA